MEDTVLRTSGGLLGTEQVETMWETAVAKMISVLEEQCLHMNSANHILLVNDYVTLFGTTFRQYGYELTPPFEAMDSSRDKHQQLLFAECKEKIVGEISNDTYELMVMKKDTNYENNVLSFHLQTTDITPAFPSIAPCSAMVPDSFNVVKRYLDKILIDVLNEALLNTIHSGSIGVSQAMQIAANITFLELAYDFFIRHAVQLWGVPIRSVERPQASLTAKVVLKTSRDAAYIALLNLVNCKLDEFMALTENINWITEEIPENGNEYINKVLIYLETLMSTAQQMLPLDALYKVATLNLRLLSLFFHASYLIVSPPNSTRVG